MPARKAAIAAGHPATASVGAAVLARGGTAVDAVVAAAIAAWVAEPSLTGPGGGGYVVAHDARSGRTLALDCFTAIPGLGGPGRAAQPMDDLWVEFGTTRQLFRVGTASCAVPGVPAGLEEAHRRFGKLPWRDLVAPAIEIGRSGAEVTEAHAYVLEILDAVLRRRPEAREVFGPEGRMLRTGDTVRNVKLAATLERVAERGAAELYTGATGREIVRYLREHGGAISHEDMAAYRAIARRPLRSRFAGRELVQPAPPNSGGLLIARSLAVLDRLGPAGDPDDPRMLQRIAHALRSAQRARTPAFERALVRGGAVRRLLAHDAIEADVAALGASHAPSLASARGTSHISALTPDGSGAAFTASTGCGSGVLVGDTGVHLNNMLGETDLALGAVALAPGSHMTSMMSPTLALGPDGVEAALGSSGSERIRSAIVQVLSHVLVRGLSARAAIDRPRVHPNGDALDCEGGFPEATLDGLEALGEQVVRWRSRNLYFGGAQVAVRHGGVMEAAGDPRRGGAGVVIEI